MNPRHTLATSIGVSLVVLLSGCSVKATFKQTSDTTSNITGTTSGRVWWNENGLLKPEHQVSAFLAYNAQNLETDLARGQGEYLASLGTLLGTPEPETFHLIAQDAFSRWSQSGSTSTEDLMSPVLATRR